MRAAHRGERADAGVARRSSLKDAAIAPADVSYVNAHGTSTPANDFNETRAIKAVFGDHAKKLNVSSTKSATGHMLGAAGALEFVVSSLVVRDGVIPPTINYAIPDPAIPLDVVPNTARDASLRHAISNSFGFGGQNVSLVMGLEPA